MKRMDWKKIVYSLVIAGLIVASFLAGQLIGRTPVAQASGSEPAPQMASARYTCTLTEVGVIDNRIHIRCSTAISGTSISYFSYPVTGVNTNRILAVGLTANALGKKVALDYETSTASNPAGCLTSDCRYFYTLWIIP